MSEQALLCIGGPLDGRTVSPGEWLPTSATAEEYTKECVYIEGIPTLFFLVHISLSTSAAMHTVFAAYAKKGKR